MALNSHGTQVSMQDLEIREATNGLRAWVTGQVTLELAFISQPTSEKCSFIIVGGALEMSPEPPAWETLAQSRAEQREGRRLAVAPLRTQRTAVQGPP